MEIYLFNKAILLVWSSYLLKIGVLPGPTSIFLISWNVWTGVSRHLPGHNPIWTYITSLTMEISDHVPCIITISIAIPKRLSLHVQNYWFKLADFLRIVEQGWFALVIITEKAKPITTKLKILRKVIEHWKSTLSSLKSTISNVKLTRSLLSLMKEFRDVTFLEGNSRRLFQQKLLFLLIQ